MANTTVAIKENSDDEENNQNENKTITFVEKMIKS